MLLRVINLTTGDERYCDGSQGPQWALAAVYAQVEKKDWDTQGYEQKYFPLVRLCGEMFYLVDWVCPARRT